MANGKITAVEVYKLVDSSKYELKEDILRVESKLDGKFKNYVTKVEFWPVRTIVYGGAGIVLVAVMGALVTLVLRG